MTREESSSMKTIVIANQKGGVGKTTTAVCMAAILRARKKKVLLVDTDMQCNATDSYQAKVEDTCTLYDLILEEKNPCTLGDTAISRSEAGCSFLLHTAGEMRCKYSSMTARASWNR